MTLLVTPIEDDWPVPPLGPQQYGYLVWLRFDHEASDAGALQFNAAGDMLLNFAFRLLGEGPSDVRTHSIPIAPAPQLTEERPPIELTPPLPWSNLYVHSHVMSGGIVSCIHHGTGQFKPVLSEAQAKWVFRVVFNDVVTHNNAQATAAAARRAAKVEAALAEDNANRQSNQDGVRHDTGSDAQSLELDVQSIDDKFQRLRAHVGLWLDPSSSYPGPPASSEAWNTAMDCLKAIWDEWRDRAYDDAKTSGTRKADAWVQSVHPTSQLPHDKHELLLVQPLDDDAVLPEDAVDYRLEQEGARGSSPSVFDVMYEEWKNDSHQPGLLPGPLIPQGSAALLAQSIPPYPAVSVNDHQTGVHVADADSVARDSLQPAVQQAPDKLNTTRGEARLLVPLVPGPDNSQPASPAVREDGQHSSSTDVNVHNGQAASARKPGPSLIYLQMFQH
ncbi:hypothetical protein AURDEDRAFT_171855 [Auricularia subglabra TFB-10046 SS5]|uniref:Uncharacterized protein n=1 Tax=Auricularia subglabra (strain TFB-10046 / SS5) TaxID=717982 RepID=J0WVL5_AURST|nr:hypothetical protein AURDEDRAFT_171855 [Auricularia subglabra TFB-10046 SS5]